MMGPSSSSTHNQVTRYHWPLLQVHPWHHKRNHQNQAGVK
ncbi:hypothetical protein OROMI_010074 [Orobanche minor]